MSFYPIIRRLGQATPGLSCCRGRLALVLLLVAGAALAGCRRTESIQSYTVAKEPPPPAAAAVAGEPTDRMLAAGELPAGHPPIDASHDQQAAAIRFTAPDSWQELPASGMRKAAFRIAGGDAEAQVTVLDFPDTAGPAIADPLANVNRWRGEVGLEPLAGDALSAAVETLEIGGRQATYVAAVPDAAGQQSAVPQRGTLAAMVANDNRVWFFKLTGDRDLVAVHQDEFRSFLQSVRFAADEGAADGN